MHIALESIDVSHTASYSQGHRIYHRPIRSLNPSIAYNSPLSKRSQHSTKHIMGNHTARRKSSFHWTAEAYLGFGIGFARRVSYAERRSSYAERRSSKSKRTSGSSPSASLSHKTKRNSTSSSQHKSKPAKSYPCYYQTVTPEHAHSHQYQYRSSHTFHGFCVASDATYARLAARLELLRTYEEDIAACVRARGESSRMGRVAEGLREDIGTLEEILEGMRRKIDEGEGEWGGNGKAFVVGGRWATFL